MSKKTHENPWIRKMYAKMYTMSTGKYADPNDPVVDAYVNDTSCPPEQRKKMRQPKPKMQAKKNNKK